MHAFFVLLLIAFDVLKAEVSEDATLRTVWKLDESQLKLAYGSMLNISCISHDDCLLKHSNCNPLSKRCECDIGSLQDNSRCEVIQCKSSNECLGRFSNTVCMFGRCQCLYGLKANGQCVQLEVETVKQLPDWAISMIAVAALFSGLLGGRSQVAAQVLQHVMAIIGILAARVGNKSSTRPDIVDAIPSSCESAEGKDGELHSKMLDSESHLELQRISLVSMAPPSSSSPNAAFTTRTSQVLIEEARSSENKGQA